MDVTMKKEEVYGGFAAKAKTHQSPPKNCLYKRVLYKYGSSDIWSD